MKKVKLYAHQEKCISNIISTFKKTNTLCLAWYTGAGKTNIFSGLCEQLIAANPSIKIGISAYLTKDIKNQIHERLEEFGLGDKDHVVTSGETLDLHKNIYVFNPQTLFRRDIPFKFDLFIVDESQAGMNERAIMIRKIMKKACHKKTKILLVSATPWDLLAMEEFKNIPVLKRSLSDGLKDGLISDFTFYGEEAQISFNENDFSRDGDLKYTAAMKKTAVIKSACVGKMQNIINRYGEKIGRKVVVVCPPGNYGEIPIYLQSIFGGVIFLQEENKLRGATGNRLVLEMSENLKSFRDNPKTRFMFVINKCSVGFDMKDLDTIIDLTMTRNVKTLAQRSGRVARKNGDAEKKYFYVYDRSLIKDRLEWLIATMIDFSLGQYDGWTTRKSKWRSVDSGFDFIHDNTTTLSKVILALSDKSAVHTTRRLSWFAAEDYKRPTQWTLKSATEKMKTYSSRTDMWSKQPSLYKWFRINAKPTMDKHFPIKNKIGKWNETTVSAALKNCKNRHEFKFNYSGALHWTSVNKRSDLVDKYLPCVITRSKYTEDSVKDELKKMKIAFRIRNNTSLRSWIDRNGGVKYWKNVWYVLHGKMDSIVVKRQPHKIKNQKKSLAAYRKKYRRIKDFYNKRKVDVLGNKS